MRPETRMQIQLREIPSEGLPLDLDLSGAWTRESLAGTEAEGTDRGLHADLVLYRNLNNVTLQGRLTGELSVPCSRCTEPARLPIDEAFRVTFVRKEDLEPEDDDEVALEEEDLELSTFEGETLDLRDTLREQVLLALPMQHLCQSDCRGLCNQCGANLNQGTCDCPPAPTDDRWAALRNLKLEK